MNNRLNDIIKAIDTMGPDKINEVSWKHILLRNDFNMNFINRYKDYLSDSIFKFIDRERLLSSDELIKVYPDILKTRFPLRIKDKDKYKEIVMTNINKLSCAKLLYAYETGLFNDNELLQIKHATLQKLIGPEKIEPMYMFYNTSIPNRIFTFSELFNLINQTVLPINTKFIYDCILHKNIKDDYIINDDIYYKLLSLGDRLGYTYLDIVSPLTINYNLSLSMHIPSNICNSAEYNHVYNILANNEISDEKFIYLYSKLIKYKGVSNPVLLLHGKSDKLLHSTFKITPVSYWDNFISEHKIDLSILMGYHEQFTPKAWQSIVNSYKLSRRFIDRYHNQLFLYTHIVCNQVLTLEQSKLFNLDTYCIALEKDYGVNGVDIFIVNTNPDMICINHKFHDIADIENYKDHDIHISDEDSKKIDKCIADAKKYIGGTHE